MLVRKRMQFVLIIELFGGHVLNVVSSVGCESSLPASQAPAAEEIQNTNIYITAFLYRRELKGPPANTVTVMASQTSIVQKNTVFHICKNQIPVRLHLSVMTSNI